MNEPVYCPGDDDYGRARCKHGIVKHVRCRDCENEPIDPVALAKFKREVLGIIEPEGKKP